MNIIAALLLWNMPFLLKTKMIKSIAKKTNLKIFQIGTYRHQELAYESQQW